MLEAISKSLSGIPATVISGIFLLLHFVLPAVGITLLFDPAWFAVIISGLPLLFQALERLIRGKGVRRLSSSLLITVAMAAAIIIGDLFAAGEVAVIMAIGTILEEMTVNRARRGVHDLLDLAPAMGRKISAGGEVMIPTTEIKKGDRLRVLPGEAIPADGIIVSGETSIDQSIMTGESLPVDRSEGDEVFCGAINRFGAIDIEAVHVGENSSLQKMARLVQDAEHKKAPTERIVDKYASWMVPLSLTIALVTYLITQDITRAVTVLLVFCPCALTLATPTAIMAAIGQAAKHGVIIKSGEALEAMGKADTVTFDKTGTLTTGRLEVCDVISYDPSLDRDALLALAASTEAKSEHPLGKAIVACAKNKKMELRESEDFRMTTGKGIYARLDGRDYYLGNERFLADSGIALTAATGSEIEQLRRDGKAMILVGTDGHRIGVIALSDAIRPTAKKMIAELAGLNTNAVLLTGDHLSTAAYFAGRVGIKDVYGQLLPEEKASRIARLQEEGHRVCMIGDGVNDAVALKTASVGVAMGSMGSDIAIEAADVALMSDDISKLPYLKRLSNSCVTTIKVGISASMIINIIALVLSVLGILGPTTGALVHNVGSVLVVMFAGMLYGRDFTGETAKHHTGRHQRLQTKEIIPAGNSPYYQAW